jgi:hypothetical protein
MAEASKRCIRCLNAFTGAGHIMAGRQYCCSSCSVGSACEHQRIHRPPNVRRYDTSFRPFRAVVRHPTPYERDLPE